MPKYMIHACPARMWYVEEFLIPSLLAQGIERESVRVWLDERRSGNLYACMEAFLSLAGSDGGTWHLQDDVIICRDFAARTAEHDEGVVCGYCFEEFGPDIRKTGRQPAQYMWNSFPCIRIPDEIAVECAAWVISDAQHRPEYERWVKTRRHDDGFWWDFYQERYPEGTALNLTPCLVDHVDYLIGGPQANRWRDHKCRSAYWEDEELVRDLEHRIRERQRGR